jgi:penicillin-binding protein 1B
MKRATALPAYKDTKPFDPPSGIVEESIDPETGQLATPSCPQTATEYFIDGSQPTQYCQLHGGATAQSGPGSWLAHLFGKGGNSTTESNNPQAQNSPSAQGSGDQDATEPEKKKGVLSRIFGIFGGSKPPATPQPQPQQ